MAAAPCNLLAFGGPKDGHHLPVQEGIRYIEIAIVEDIPLKLQRWGEAPTIPGPQLRKHGYRVMCTSDRAGHVHRFLVHEDMTGDQVSPLARQHFGIA